MKTTFDFLENVSLKDYSTFTIGGKAKYLYIVKTQKNLIDICNFLLNKKIKFKVIGLGANLLFDDFGFDGAIVVNRTSHYKIFDNSITISSGEHLSSLISLAKLNNLSNIESLSAIPASVGGAIVNNVGSKNCEISNFVVKVKVFDLKTKKIKYLNNKDCKFSYRTSIFKKNRYVILSAKILFVKSTFWDIQYKIHKTITDKQTNQPVGNYSAGSIFKQITVNGDKFFPSKEIDALNLKGKTIGGAQISIKHAGFIININNASSQDVKLLIKLIKKTIYDKFEINLIEEIEFVD